VSVNVTASERGAACNHHGRLCTRCDQHFAPAHASPGPETGHRGPGQAHVNPNTYLAEVDQVAHCEVQADRLQRRGTDNYGVCHIDEAFAASAQAYYSWAEALK
jgi:hypothetical protein